MLLDVVLDRPPRLFARQGRKGLGNIYVWASGDGGEEDDCNCDGYAASMWTISINSAINDGQNAHYDESCSSTLASTFSNGAKDPNTGVVSEEDTDEITFECDQNKRLSAVFTGYHRSVWKMYDDSQRDVRRGAGSRWSICACSRS